MSDVALTVGGHVYRIACAAGQEESLSKLAAYLNEKMEQQRAQSGALSEVRQLLFVALTLADELQEAQTELAHWQSLASHFDSVGQTGRAIDNLAQRLENLATELEKSSANA